MLWVMFGCSSSLSGTWFLEGIDPQIQARGYISMTNGKASIELHSDRWGTEGMVPADVKEEDGAIWLYFPFQTGLSSGDGALRLQGKEAMLPLGARAGEFEIYFHAHAGQSLPDSAAQRERSRKGLEAERQFWKEGSFRLRTKDGIVGEFQLGDLSSVMVYDPLWLTPERVSISPSWEGADILVSFPIEPSIAGEEGLIRINIPTREVVVPISTMPDPMDRHFQLEPGQVSSDERNRLVDRAIQTADQREKEWVYENAPFLFQGASCETLVQKDPNEHILWRGYRLEWVAEHDEDCSISIEPIPPQHRRRFRGQIKKSEI